MSEQLWKCGRRKCGWVGTDAEKNSVKDSPMAWTLVCPRCGERGFYEGRPGDKPSRLPMIDLLGLNPGIRVTVAVLRNAGFDTCDSGDGSTHEHGCDLDQPYVHIVVPKSRLIEETDRLFRLLQERGVKLDAMNEDNTAPTVQASYDPVAKAATISVFNVKLAGSTEVRKETQA